MVSNGAVPFIPSFLKSQKSEIRRRRAVKGVISLG